MDYTSINNALYRPIFSGVSYDTYMPYSDCSSLRLGFGDTKFSIDKMKDTAIKYRHHTERLTEVFFNQKNINDLCKEIHRFLYHHLQYKLDGEKQKLRSPACSWASRKEGIDCKSYSIFASTILQNAGVSHYMRRIKQASNPNGFTHVYIVVPIDQKRFNLTKGYYTIDGTIPQFTELSYIEADNVFIFSGKTTKTIKGLGVVDQYDAFLSEESEKAKQYAEYVASLKAQNTAGIVDLIGGTAAAIAHCILGVGSVVGTALTAVTALVTTVIRFGSNPCSTAFYTADFIKENLKKEFLPTFKKIVASIQADIKNDTQALGIGDVNKILKEIDLGFAHYMHQYETHSGNDCSVQSLKSYMVFATKMHEIANEVIEGMKLALEKYFNVAVIEKKARTTERGWYFIVPSGVNPIEATYRELVVEGKEKKKGIYPYGDALSFDKWLEDNVIEISVKYGNAQGERYRSEMLPFKAKIEAIRQNLALPMITRMNLEDALRKQEYDIYLKYDKDYLYIRNH
ncbi:hypothetical protein, partial [Capnocytophaga catalasegens]